MSPYVPMSYDVYSDMCLFFADVPDEEAMNVITSMPWVMGNHAYKTEAEPMLQETREVLYEFYRPYNEHLAYMMGDDSYLWHL